MFDYADKGIIKQTQELGKKKKKRTPLLVLNTRSEIYPRLRGRGLPVERKTTVGNRCRPKPLDDRKSRRHTPDPKLKSTRRTVGTIEVCQENHRTLNRVRMGCPQDSESSKKGVKPHVIGTRYKFSEEKFSDVG